MLRSMTGHGEARRENTELEIAAEIRSVNNRFLRIITRVSDEFAFLQPTLEDEVRRRLVRGSVFLNVRVRPVTASDLFRIDEGVVRKYYLQLRGLAAELNASEAIHLRDLLPLPGVIQTDDSPVADRDAVIRLSSECVQEALAALEEMRLCEGENLRRDFATRAIFLREVLAEVHVLSPEGVKRYQQRLEERVKQALAQHEVTLSPEDLLKEVAILADRCDISEESARMQSHLDQFDDVLARGGAIGRKLEFIVQEMFREANTMVSKSVHPDLNRHLVDFKAELERLKEQIQNVE